MPTSGGFASDKLTMISANVLLTLALIFCILSSAGLLYMRRRFSVLQRKLVAVYRDLDMALRCLNDADKQKNADNFETDLLKADLKIKHAPLPVITQNNRIEDSVIPERYRHVATLSRHGLDHSEISAILRISVEEADQLIKLSRLTGRQIQ